MATTIQISQSLQEELSRKKLQDRETYEEVIWDLIEDTKSINQETKKELAQARADIKAGRVHSLAKVKELLNV